jgi:hypothetical protein
LQSYLAWLPPAGMKSQFDTLLDTLKYLPWQGLADPEKRWILKSPLYSGLEHLLLETFPDACLLMTHRTPLETVGSGLRLLECFYKPFTHLKPDPMEYVEGLKLSTQAHLDWRERQPESRILDIPFSQLVASPELTTRAIYNYTGQLLGEGSLRRMLDWDKNSRQNRYNGKHSYSLEQFGLNAGGISAEFAEYIAFTEQLEAQWQRKG